jgi:cytochrome c oxidase subunit 2
VSRPDRRLVVATKEVSFVGQQTPGSRGPVRGRVRRTAFGLVALLAMLAVSGCSAEGKDQLERLAMPAPRTKESQAIYDLWHWSWLAAIIVGVLVWGLIGYAVVHFRRRSDDEIPVQTRYNLPIEIFYTVAPVMIVVVFFFFTLKAQEEVLPSDAKAGTPDQTILVVGQQWSWTFNYEKALDGKTVYEGGTTADEPTLWLPVDKKIRFNLYSPDVIHSFWVPSFLFKMDVVPGRDNHFSLTPNREGTYVGKCAELCGVYHSRMLFNVKVVSEDAYEAHLQDLSDAGNNGEAKGSKYDTTQPGLKNSEGGTE